MSVCAEAVVLGKAISEGEWDFDTIVAVRHPDLTEGAQQEIEVVSPCGFCRELISDYGPEINVILKKEDKYIKVKVSELLPEKYTRGE
ncbi:cytidine deaminase [Paenibacillus sp. Marseille-Q7038]